MHKRNFVFLSLAVVIFLGATLDYALGNTNSKQDEMIISQLSQNSFTNIKLVNMGGSCIGNTRFDIKKLFVAEKDGKIVNGKFCKNKNEAKSIISIESSTEKIDPANLKL